MPTSDLNNTIFEIIKESAIYGNLGLFIGAGFPMAVLNSESDKIALNWNDLIKKSAEELDLNIELDIKEKNTPPEIVSNMVDMIVERKKNTREDALREIKTKIAEITRWHPEVDKRREYSEILEKISPKWIVTTNYDTVIESLLVGKSESLDSGDVLSFRENLIPIYHLHGIRTNPDSIIISQEDYVGLLRPGEYRQFKMSSLFKESVTLIIGYKLNDINVLTAVDWSQNVWSKVRSNYYPNAIIQLLYVKNNPSKNPYEKNGILVKEFSDLKVLLKEISDYVINGKKSEKEIKTKIVYINEELKNPNEDIVNGFIKNEKDFRAKILDGLSKSPEISSGFLDLFTRSMDQAWENTRRDRAFYEYDVFLKILLDVIKKINILKSSPVFIESIAYYLDKVSPYIGTSLGDSYAAHETWQKEKVHISGDLKKELLNIAQIYNYRYLKLFKD